MNEAGDTDTLNSVHHSTPSLSTRTLNPFLVCDSGNQPIGSTIAYDTQHTKRCHEPIRHEKFRAVERANLSTSRHEQIMPSIAPTSAQHQFTDDYMRNRSIDFNPFTKFQDRSMDLQQDQLEQLDCSQKQSEWFPRMQPHNHEHRKPIKVGPYDGTTAFETFIAQFRNAAEYNKWSEEDCLANMKACLKGNAAHVLWDTPLYKQDTIQKLLDILST